MKQGQQQQHRHNQGQGQPGRTQAAALEDLIRLLAALNATKNSLYHPTLDKS
jgi:hypothetical protein